jgi:hypothetical protein
MGAFAVHDAASQKAGKPEPNGLEFIPPDTLRIGDQEQSVGGVVYRLLQTLFETPKREQRASVLELEVWGRFVNRSTLESACRRARAVLIEMEHPLRVAIDGDRVALV